MANRIEKDIGLDRKDVDDAKRMIGTHGLDEGSPLYQKWQGRLPSVMILLRSKKYKEYADAFERSKNRFGKIDDYAAADLAYVDTVSRIDENFTEFKKDMICCTAYNEIMNDNSSNRNFFRVVSLRELLVLSQTGRFVSDTGINYEPDGSASKSFTWNPSHSFIRASNIVIEFKNSGNTGILPLALRPYPRMEATMKNGLGIIPNMVAQMEGRIDITKTDEMPEISSVVFGRLAHPRYDETQIIKKALPDASIKFKEV